MRPYVHFTTSAILPFLAKSNFSLVSLDTMLYELGFAPMAGEISRGGVVGAGDDVTTAFASLSENPNSKWNISELYKNYGKFQWQPTLLTEDDVDKHFQQTLSLSLTNIRPFMINVMRHKQMDVFPEISDMLKEKIFKTIIHHIGITLRQYAINYLFAKYVTTTPNSEYSRTALYKYMDKLEKTLPSNFLSLTESEQRDIAQALTLPQGLEFYEDNKPSENVSMTYDLEYNLSLAVRFSGRSDFISEIVEIHLNKRPVAEIKNELMACYQRVNKVFRLVKDVLENDRVSQLSFAEKFFIENAFPIAFVLTDRSKLERIREEYRSTETFSLGRYSDIKVLATDAEHVDTLQTFLKEAGQSSIRVINIKQLKQLDIKPKTTTWDFFQENKTATALGSAAVVAAASYLAYSQLKS